MRAIAVFLFALSCSALAEAPLELENRALRLRFEPDTGAWIGLTDKTSGDELVTGPAADAGVAPPGVPRLNLPQIERAVAEGAVLSLTGDWLYTPTPPGETQATNFLTGRYDSVAWVSTPIPSRRGMGDDRLHDRAGDFWYRREFSLSTNWPGGDAALVIGAVDDFDVTFINGTRIGSTGVEVSHHWESPRFYRVPASLLRPGQTNVLLIKVTNPAYDGGIDGPVVLGPVSRLSAPRSDCPPLTGHAFDQANGTKMLRLSARSGKFEYRAEFVLSGDEPRFTRRLSVKNISDSEELFQTASYRTPILCAGPEQAVIFPGSLPAGDNPVARMTDGSVLRPRTEDPLAVLWDADRRRGVGAWFHCEEEFSPVSVQRVGPGAQIRHDQRVVVRLAPGEAVALGREFFWVSHGSRDTALRGVQDVYRTIGLRAPANSLAGLRGKVLYCGHPGGPPELNYLKYGGFKALDAYVPVLRRLQVDLLWLLPIWEHGDGTKWNLYSPFDHFQVDHLLGTADDLKQLSGNCAKNQIRLMFDLVPHGPPDFTPLAKEHPEWIARKPDGSNQTEWNQLAFDNNHPGWQEYMGRAAEWGAREFGAVGARVDCGAGGPLNWSRTVTSRPSLSSLAAALGMNRAIREGYLRAAKEVVVLPEEYTGANIFYRIADLTYDAQFYYVQAELLERNSPPEDWARGFQQFLHDQQQTVPPGALKMRWISNHDTVSWTFQKRRPAQAYGLERMRALLALCAWIDGVPMLYQGDEDPAVYGGRGEASVDFLARVYGLRKELPALREGTADYTSVRASDGVFACLRQSGPASALVLVSFNPASVETVVTGPAVLKGPWRDRMSDERWSAETSLRVPMKPYQARVLTGAE